MIINVALGTEESKGNGRRSTFQDDYPLWKRGIDSVYILKGESCSVYRAHIYMLHHSVHICKLFWSEDLHWKWTFKSVLHCELLADFSGMKRRLMLPRQKLHFPDGRVRWFGRPCSRVNVDQYLGCWLYVNTAQKRSRSNSAQSLSKLQTLQSPLPIQPTTAPGLSGLMCMYFCHFVLSLYASHH